MDSQDPKKRAPKEIGAENGSNRDDSNHSGESGYQRFAKDKRARVGVRVEKVSRERKTDSVRDERPDRGREDRPYENQRSGREPQGRGDWQDRPRREPDYRGGGRDDRGRGGSYPDRGDRPPRDYREQRDDRNRGGYGDRDDRYPRRDGGDAPRRSFNPNFTPDNRPKNDGGSYPRRDYDDRGRRPYNDDDKWNRVDYDPSREGRPDRDSRPGGYKKPGGYDKPGGYGKPGGRPQYDREPRSDFRKPGDRQGRPGYPGGSKKYGDGGGGRADRKPQKAFRPGDEYPKYAPPKIDKPIRLNRFLAMSGIASRREADDLILAGVVTVNGEVVSELGSKVQPTDEVRFNDAIVRGEKKVYILMNKPKGFVTTLEDPHSDKTVMDIIKGAVKERVYPVGRLDKNSVGVLLITNDGDLTKRLTHPSYKKKKVYQVSLDKPLVQADMEEIAEGIELEDGPIRADEIAYVDNSKREIGIEIHSGRNRIVRRIFEQLGYKVQKLDRVYFAGLTKKRLKRGAWRFLSPQEVSMLKSGEYE